jgi:hypothetical protein
VVTAAHEPLRRRSRDLSAPLSILLHGLSILLRCRNGRLDAAATPPAEASSKSGATPTAWKESIVVLMRSGVWFARGGRGIAGGEFFY